MPRYRVELEGPPIRPVGMAPRNPFLVRDISRLTEQRLVRTWEFAADSEQEVRRLLDVARAFDLENVRGFNLRSISELGSNAKLAP